MRCLQHSVTTLASPTATWAVLADFGGVAKWAPGMRSSRVLGDQYWGVGAHRALRHILGFRIEEVVTHWTEGVAYGFDLTRTPFPMRNVSETLGLEPAGELTRIISRVSYDMRLGALGRFFDWIFLRHFVTREMRASLRGLKAFIEQRAPVSDEAPVASEGMP